MALVQAVPGSKRMKSVAFPLVGIYNASKFAMEAVTEALAQEMGEFGIKVTAIEPECLRLNGSAVRCDEANRLYRIMTRCGNATMKHRCLGMAISRKPRKRS
jgi:NAD(P)-dependent dehydrogenase (short-subunit alcohol dehydrogenase family)